jgi:hypothetical protein
MTKTAARIGELFRTLPARDQRAVIEQLSATAHGASSYGRLSLAQRAEIDEALGEAERGETIPAGESFDDLAQRYGFANA